MKVSIRAITERGTFNSIAIDTSGSSTLKTLEEIIKRASSGESDYLILDAKHGDVYIGKDLLTKSVFEVLNNVEGDF